MIICEMFEALLYFKKELRLSVVGRTRSDGSRAPKGVVTESHMNQYGLN